MNINSENNGFYDAPTDTIWFYDKQGRLKGIDQCPNCVNGEQVDGNYLRDLDRKRVEAGLQESIKNQRS